MAAAEHSENSDFLEVDNAIYEATVTTTSAQEKDPRQKIRPSDTRRNKRVGVGVGLLVAVLVLLNVAVPLYLHQSYKVEKEQLVVSYDNLTKERDQLLDRITNLTVESIPSDQSYKVEKEQLEISYNNLIKERDQLLDRNYNLAVERDNLKSMLCESPGWLKFDRGLYYISTLTKNWEDSRHWCRNRQSDLIVIKSQRKQDFVASFNKRVWLGLTDTEREGSFQWVDGTPLTATNWLPGIPTINEEQDCVEYYDGSVPGFTARGWNDARCSTSLNYWICERVLC